MNNLIYVKYLYIAIIKGLFGTCELFFCQTLISKTAL